MMVAAFFPQAQIVGVARKQIVFNAEFRVCVPLIKIKVARCNLEYLFGSWHFGIYLENL